MKLPNFQDKISFYSILTTIVLALSLMAFYFLSLSRLPNQLPLFYSLPWGNSQLALSQQFLVLPLLIILITVVNLIIMMYLHISQTMLKKIICLTTLLISVLILVTGVKIIKIFT